MTRISFALMIALVLALGATLAQAGPNNQGSGYRVAAFVDENGDGFNDLAPDADGDGIPNGLDADYERPQDGSGAGFGRRADSTDPQTGTRRAMGDPASTHYLFWGPFGPLVLEATGQGHGPGDGTGFGGDGPGDGNGFGPGSGTGTGTCDGTGPDGQQQGGTPDRGNRR